MLSLDRQLELYTALADPAWLTSEPEYQSDPVRYLVQCQRNWSFTEADLRAYLERSPDLIDSYFDYCETLAGTHDKVVLGRVGDQFVVYWLDHGEPRDNTIFDDRLEAVMSWLKYRYLN